MTKHELVKLAKSIEGRLFASIVGSGSLHLGYEERRWWAWVAEAMGVRLVLVIDGSRCRRRLRSVVGCQSMGLVIRFDESEGSAGERLSCSTRVLLLAIFRAVELMATGDWCSTGGTHLLW